MAGPAERHELQIRRAGKSQAAVAPIKGAPRVHISLMARAAAWTVVSCAISTRPILAVLRCATCEGVLMVVVHAGGRFRLGLQGLVWLEIQEPVATS